LGLIGGLLMEQKMILFPKQFEGLFTCANVDLDFFTTTESISKRRNQDMNALSIKSVEFRYSATTPNVLQIPSMTVDVGEKVFLYGPSGCGKTTLLGLVGGLFLPNCGDISVLGQPVSAMRSAARDRFRAQEIGFIFQVFNLVSYLSVVDNVTLPCQFGRRVSAGFATAEQEAMFLLGQLGIAEAASKELSKLSIGQQQRVAAARALMGSPGIIIADEPTSALDAEAREGFLSVLFEQAKREGSSILFVSHDRSIAPQFDRSIALSDVNMVRTPKNRGDA
jgi:putative ABC transport system ATP-binding protein